MRTKELEKPKLGSLVPVIDAILEADKTAPPKQRHTAKRIFERLRIEHGFLGGYTGVKDYVRLAETRSREVFVPLAHPTAQAVLSRLRAAMTNSGIDKKLSFRHLFIIHNTPMALREAAP